MTMTISDELRQLAAEKGDAFALGFDGVTEFTFRELDDAVERFALALLHKERLKPGDRVALVLKNRPEYIIAYFSAARAGLVIVPVNRRASAPEITRIIESASARMLITEPAYAHIADAVTAEVPDLRVVTVGAEDGSFESLLREGDTSAVLPAVSWNSLQAIHYTSGTTGVAKGVMRTHAANACVSRGAVQAATVHPGDVWLHTLPMNSVGVYAFAIAPLLAGAGLLITADVNPELILDLAERYRVAMLHAVPTVWEMLMRGNSSGAVNRLESVRFAYWGGSPLPRGTAERLEGWMATPALGCYGSTESPCISYSTSGIYRSGRYDSSGLLIDGMQIRVVDDAGNEIPSGEMGEVQLKGAALMQGYFGRPDLTAAAFTPDGWYITGDWGRIDGDGAVTVTDRKKDMIISGGENVYPGEVENVISAVAGVSEVAVVGVPDDLWGQTIWAFVRTDGRVVDEQDVVAACRARLAGYKTPRKTVFIDKLPVNGTGKVQKDQLVVRAVELISANKGVTA